MSIILHEFHRAAAWVGGFIKRRKITFSVVSAAIVIGCVSGALLLPRGNAAPVVSNPKTAVSLAPSSSAPVSSEAAPIRSRKADILAAEQKNPDVAGWLTVPGTDLDMPIVHTNNNDYYLKHNLEKQSYKKGWPFLDYRSSAGTLGRNSIIYGHNMGDGTLFGELKKYKDLSFLNQHPVIYFGTASTDRYWKIFAVYTTDVNFYYIKTDFKNNSDFASLVKQMRAQSMFNTSVSVSPTDDILTLSTCTYDFDNARFVVEARLVAPTESYTVAPATKNSSPASPHHKAS